MINSILCNVAEPFYRVLWDLEYLFLTKSQKKVLRNLGFFLEAFYVFIEWKKAHKSYNFRRSVFFT